MTYLGLEGPRLDRTTRPRVPDPHDQRLVIRLAGELDGAVFVRVPVRDGVGDQLIRDERRVVAQLVGGGPVCQNSSTTSRAIVAAPSRVRGDG